MQSPHDTLSILRKKRQSLIDSIAALEKDLEHVNATIRIFEQEIREMTIQLPLPKSEPDFTLAKLKGLKQSEALMVIANHFGGIVRAQEVKHLLIRGGVMRETKNSTNITHNLIIRTGRFERIAPGEYRLKDRNVVSKSTTLEDIARIGTAIKPVQ